MVRIYYLADRCLADVRKRTDEEESPVYVGLFLQQVQGEGFVIKYVFQFSDQFRLLN